MYKIGGNKSLGDFLQELNVVIKNGGFKNLIKYKNGDNILKYDAKGDAIRFGAMGDQPSGARVITLLSQSDPNINKKAYGGFLAKKTHQKNTYIIEAV